MHRLFPVLNGTVQGAQWMHRLIPVPNVQGAQSLHKSGNQLGLLVRWPDQGTPQILGETILLHFLIDMMVLIKNQEGVEV